MAETSEIRALARLYVLLSEFSDAELSAAAEIDGLSKPLANAFLALATARQDINQNIAKKRKSKAEKKARPGREIRPKAKASLHSPDRRAAVLLERAILDRRFFRSTHDLEKFFRQYNVQLIVHPKESRSRLLSRTRQILETLPQADKERVATALEQLMDSRQTSGWFSVIRSGGK